MYFISHEIRIPIDQISVSCASYVTFFGFKKSCRFWGSPDPYLSTGGEDPSNGLHLSITDGDDVTKATGFPGGFQLPRV